MYVCVLFKNFNVSFLLLVTYSLWILFLYGNEYIFIFIFIYFLFIIYIENTMHSSLVPACAQWCVCVCVGVCLSCVCVCVCLCFWRRESLINQLPECYFSGFQFSFFFVAGWYKKQLQFQIVQKYFYKIIIIVIIIVILIIIFLIIIIIIIIIKKNTISFQFALKIYSIKNRRLMPLIPYLQQQK